MVERNRGESRSRSQRKPSAKGEDSPRSLTPERQEQRARNVLLYQLSRSAKTAKQCRDILEKREIDPEIAEQVILRYIEVGLIDDVAVARTIVNSRRTYKGLSRSAIKRELVTRGIAQEVIEEAVAPLDSESEQQAATDLAKRRIARMGSLQREVRQRRLMGFLARKGFASALIAQAVRLAEADFTPQG